jgi:phospholipase C
MASASTWERIERQKLRQRERRTRPARPGDRPDPSRPAGTDLLPQVKHIIVLMMENHSFDNYFGTLGRGEGLPRGDDGMPDGENPDSAGNMIRAYHASSTVQEIGVPCQSWSASHAEWAGGKMTGFVTSTEQAAPGGNKAAAMAYWTDQDLPFNLLDRPKAGTIMDMLTRHEISWVNYRSASSDQSEFRRWVH